MMLCEFIERTHYEPSYEEYAIIEEAYYDFEGDKNEFCKWFLDAQKRGYWEREYRVRLALKESDCEVRRLKESVLKAEADASEYWGRALKAERVLRKVRDAIE